MLLNSAPNLRLTFSPNLRVLLTPRFVPQVPGPRSRLRLATLGLSSTSAPAGGNPKASGLKNRSPDLTCGSLVTIGRNPLLLLNPPIGSIDVLKILPSVAAPHLHHAQERRKT